MIKYYASCKKEEEKRQSIPHLRETYEFEITAECLIYRLRTDKHYHIIDLNVLSLEIKEFIHAEKLVV